MHCALQLSLRRALRLTFMVSAVLCAGQIQCRAEPYTGMRGISPAADGNFSRAGSADGIAPVALGRRAGNYAVVERYAYDLGSITDVELLANARLVVGDGFVR